MILVCSQKPVAPVSWIFRALPDSEPRHIVTDGLVDSDYTERFGIHGSSLIIHKVQPTDYGSYDCHDANRDVFMYNVTVVGEEIVFISKCKKHDVRAINHTYL